MCFKSFKSVRTTIKLFQLIQCVSKVLNLCKTLADQHCKVLSHEFDGFQKFQICSNYYGTMNIGNFRGFRCASKASNVFEPLLSGNFT